ncbi:MAG: ribosomal protein S3, eukaryotic/archaeal type [uncultured Acidilobus sp. CIS]|nr:MAG: ribosomal protein S3, eukaryotic/archaeal type [uncultured Acidilobus sp. CIS]NAZ39292.1 30S ribosomal protein S3 [Acidilobus sp.]
MSRIKNYFLRQELIRVRLDEYLAQNFHTAGYAGLQMVQSGLGTRVHIFAERPALIIGRRGATIRKLQAVFQKVFSLENVQISVSQPDNMELNARVQAFRIARSLEMGYHFRRVAMATMRRIMEAGAAGVEVVISGKLTRERARFEKYHMGKVIKTGHAVDLYTDRAVAYARLPLGIIGVEVLIVKPEAAEPHIKVKPKEEAEAAAKELEEITSSAQVGGIVEESVGGEAKGA